MGLDFPGDNKLAASRKWRQLGDAARHCAGTATVALGVYAGFEAGSAMELGSKAWWKLVNGFFSTEQLAIIGCWSLLGGAAAAWLAWKLGWLTIQPRPVPFASPKPESPVAEAD